MLDGDQVDETGDQTGQAGLCHGPGGHADPVGDGRIERIERGAVELAIVQRRAVNRELPLAITLGVALPKGERQRWLVEKAVELGVARLVPLICERNVAQPTAAAIERLERYVVEASKQCGRNMLLEVLPAVAVVDFAVQAAASPPGAVRWAAHPGDAGCAAISLRDVLPSVLGSQCRMAWLAVGPEGGFAPAEVVAWSSHGWTVISLGPRQLRTETAALALVAALAAVR